MRRIIISGNIAAVANREVPLSVKSVYYLYDTPSGEKRRSHAQSELQQSKVAATISLNCRNMNETLSWEPGGNYLFLIRVCIISASKDSTFTKAHSPIFT
ncbi:hypothetical protein GZH53_16895 [Flavihumibacter sp. R14]|nr:hypothetical protein [Flavihumibacter soli]